MTREEIQKEIDRLTAMKRELEKEERETHKQQARQFVGKCYKRYDRANCESEGVFCKIISTPIEIWDMYRTAYNPYQFPALFLQFPERPSERSYKHSDIDEFVPCYCDTIYLDVKRGRPGSILRDDEYFEEVTQEEFNAEFDKCIAHFKEQINI